MRWLVFGAPLIAGLFKPLTHPPKEGSPTRAAAHGPHESSLGAAAAVLKTPSNEACTDTYECSSPPEFVEVYKTSARGMRFTDCIKWSLDCPYDGIRDRVGQNCRWNFDAGYIQVWISKNGLVIEEVYQ